MRCVGRLVVLLLLSIAHHAPAWAQLVTKPSGAGSPLGAGANQQPDTLVFNDLEVEVSQVVRGPQGNLLRVVLQITETADQGRWVSLIAPAASMIDDMGNQWIATAARGLQICFGKWDVRPAYCEYGAVYGGDLVQLSPGLRQVVVLDFSPADGGVIEETVDLASSANMIARLMVCAGKGDCQQTDVNVPGIALPKGD